jgi:hypothetical protein
MENKMTFLKENKDFRAYIHCFENKPIDGNNSTTLKPEVYNAYSRYNSNKEPLIKIFAQKEILQAQSKYQDTMNIPASNPYDIENIIVAKKEFKKEYQKIIDTYTPITDNFVKLLNTTDI